MPITPDNLIISGAYLWNKDIEPIQFITNDLNCRIIANKIFGLNSCSYQNDLKEEYKGFKIFYLDENQIADFYTNSNINQFNCLINQYVVINDLDGNFVDLRKWTNSGYVKVFDKPIRSNTFKDKFRAKDIYQQMAIDTLFNNTMSVISGQAGSGKSLLSLVVAMNLIENKKYDRLVILFNPTKTKGSFDMGYYSGNAIDKAMQNFIGQVLCTKFGDRKIVDLMLEQDIIKLVSFADCRGMEVKDNEILYISEAQNTSVELLKLGLSRASQGAKIIIEGDYNSQVDNRVFEGINNGMKRAVDILKGEDLFGYVELQNIHRSKIADLVSKM
jgi:predicted ribonuclease YlaK